MLEKKGKEELPHEINILDLEQSFSLSDVISEEEKELELKSEESSESVESIPSSFKEDNIYE